MEGAHAISSQGREGRCISAMLSLPVIAEMSSYGSQGSEPETQFITVRRRNIMLGHHAFDPHTLSCDIIHAASFAYDILVCNQPPRKTSNQSNILFCLRIGTMLASAERRQCHPEGQTLVK